MIAWWALAGLAQAGVVRHALVIGANDGGGVLEPLRFAESDAERFARVLVELGDFDEQLVTVLYRPTQETLRRALAEAIRAQGLEVVDLGADGDDSVDYPDFADALATALDSGRAGRGVLVCGTGRPGCEGAGWLR